MRRPRQRAGSRARRRIARHPEHHGVVADRAATLRAGKHRFPVKVRRRKAKVRIKPGRTRLTLHLSLVAHKLRATQTVRIPRPH